MATKNDLLIMIIGPSKSGKKSYISSIRKTFGICGDDNLPLKCSYEFNNLEFNICSINELSQKIYNFVFVITTPLKEDYDQLCKNIVPYLKSKGKIINIIIIIRYQIFRNYY